MSKFAWINDSPEKIVEKLAEASQAGKTDRLTKSADPLQWAKDNLTMYGQGKKWGAGASEALQEGASKFKDNLFNFDVKPDSAVWSAARGGMMGIAGGGLLGLGSGLLSKRKKNPIRRALSGALLGGLAGAGGGLVYHAATSGNKEKELTRDTLKAMVNGGGSGPVQEPDRGARHRWPASQDTYLGKAFAYPAGLIWDGSKWVAKNAPLSLGVAGLGVASEGARGWRNNRNLGRFFDTAKAPVVDAAIKEVFLDPNDAKTVLARINEAKKNAPANSAFGRNNWFNRIFRGNQPHDTTALNELIAKGIPEGPGIDIPTLKEQIAKAHMDDIRAGKVKMPVPVDKVMGINTAGLPVQSGKAGPSIGSLQKLVNKLTAESIGTTEPTRVAPDIDIPLTQKPEVKIPGVSDQFVGDGDIAGPSAKQQLDPNVIKGPDGKPINRLSAMPAKGKQIPGKTPQQLQEILDKALMADEASGKGTLRQQLAPHIYKDIPESMPTDIRKYMTELVEKKRPGLGVAEQERIKYLYENKPEKFDELLRSLTEVDDVTTALKPSANPLSMTDVKPKYGTPGGARMPIINEVNELTKHVPRQAGMSTADYLKHLQVEAKNLSRQGAKISPVVLSSIEEMIPRVSMSAGRPIATPFEMLTAVKGVRNAVKPPKGWRGGLTRAGIWGAAAGLPLAGGYAVEKGMERDLAQEEKARLFGPGAGGKTQAEMAEYGRAPTSPETVLVMMGRNQIGPYNAENYVKEFLDKGVGQSEAEIMARGRATGANLYNYLSKQLGDNEEAQAQYDLVLRALVSGKFGDTPDKDRIPPEYWPLLPQKRPAQ